MAYITKNAKVESFRAGLIANAKQVRSNKPYAKAIGKSRGLGIVALPDEPKRGKSC